MKDARRISKPKQKKIDPTANVVALSTASNKRQDDLRDSDGRRIDAALHYLEEMQKLRSEHMREMGQVRSEHSREIGALESNRLNAIRQVDVLAVNTAADRSQAAIQALSATTTANAENLRNAVTATATTIAAQTANTVAGITERLSALEKSSYEGKGKQALSDPMMTELVNEMKSLRDSRATGTGKSEGISSSWAILLGIVALIGGLLSIYAFTNHPANTTNPTSPQIVYMPAPIAK